MDFQGPAAPLTSAAVQQVAEALRTDVAAIWAVLTVETSGFGFLPDRRPKILFERHVFHKRTGGRFTATLPDLSAGSPGGYGASGAHQYARLSRAMAAERIAAMESASWGLGQIMGYHAGKLGYGSVDAMVASFRQDEDAQLDGVRRFIAASKGLASALARHDWATFAFFYNGAGYKRNAYDRKLADHHALFQAGHLPDLEVRGLQVRLAYLGFDPNGIDGVLCNGTRRAVLAFQRARGLTANGDPDAATLEALRAATGV